MGRLIRERKGEAEVGRSGKRSVFLESVGEVEVKGSSRLAYC